MERIVIGIVGPIASGKSLASDYLKDRGFEYTSLGDRVREEAKKKNLPITREVLQNLGNELREKFGGAILAEMTTDLIKESGGNLVIDSVRNPEEIEFLRKNFNAKIIGIDASENLRLQWYMERAKERNEDTETIEAFYKANTKDLGVGENNLGQQVILCLNKADVIIINDGSKEKIIKKLNSYFSENLGFNIEGRQKPSDKER